MSCSIRVTITVKGVSRREAEAAIRALSPDDKTAPPWLRIAEEYTGEGLRIVVESSGEHCGRIGSVRNTVDEILEFLYSLLKTLEETAKTLKEASVSPAQDVGRDIEQEAGQHPR